MVSCRSSSATCRSCLLSRRRRSAGILIRSRRGVLEGSDKRGNSTAVAARAVSVKRYSLKGRRQFNQDQLYQGQIENVGGSYSPSGEVRSARATSSVCSLSPRLRGEGWGEGRFLDD